MYKKVTYLEVKYIATIYHDTKSLPQRSWFIRILLGNRYTRKDLCHNRLARCVCVAPPKPRVVHTEDESINDLVLTKVAAVFQPAHLRP